MEYISTDESEKYDIKHGVLTESPLPGSATRFICNPIVDDIEADPDPEEQYQPPSCQVVGAPSVNDLATHRWHNNGLSDDRIEAAKIEAELIGCIQDGARRNALRPGPWKPNPGWEDQRAFRKLLEAFHRTVVGPAGKFVPKGTLYRRQPKGQKHTNDLLYEDFTSVGCLALWESTLKFDLDRGRRFSTLSRHKIIGAIRNEANYLRQQGYTSGDTVARYLRKKVSRHPQTRLDRWIFDHLGSPPEELLEFQKQNLKRPVFYSLQEAADALKAANSLEHCDVYSSGGDGCDIERGWANTGSEDDKAGCASRPIEEWSQLYHSHDPLRWSPQLAFHGNPLRGTGKVSPIIDFWIRELCDPPRIKAKPQPKPVYKPCTIKPTGRVQHPIDKPYWMEPRQKRPKVLAGEPFNPDRREAAVIRENGKTKRKYRQMSAGPMRHIEVTPELNEKYVAIYEAEFRKFRERKRRKARSKKSNVRTKPNQTTGRPSAEIIVLESRRGGQSRLHVGERHNSSRAG
jgi:hypothetical protein